MVPEFPQSSAASGAPQAHADPAAVECVARRAGNRVPRRHTRGDRLPWRARPPRATRCRCSSGPLASDAEDQRSMADRLVAGDGHLARRLVRLERRALGSPGSCRRVAAHGRSGIAPLRRRHPPGPSPIASSSADPTTAASAWPRNAIRCSCVDRPKPSARGTDVRRRTESSNAIASSAMERRAPVTPVTPTQYTNPAAVEQIRARRSGVVVGATSGITATPAACIAAADVGCLVKRKVRKDHPVDARGMPPRGRTPRRRN